MQDHLNEKRLEKIKQKVDVSDDVVYLVGKAVFHESAMKDVKNLIDEVDSCWKELKNLHESVQLLTDKVNGMA
jgi:chaperonin cofactor prefoldin